MALGWNLCLCFDNRSADRAADAIRQTRFGAGRRLARNGLLSVAGRGDLFHTGENRLTNGALRTGFMTSLGAGSGLFRNFNRSMSSRVDCFGLGCIANCAGVGLGTGVLTGSGGGNHALIPAVALCRNGFTRLLYFITNLAIGIAGVAFLSAGRLTAITNLGQRVVILPAGFEDQVGEGEERILAPFLVMKLIRLESIVANSSGDEPTGEVIAFASKATFGKRVILAGPAVDDFYRIHRADAAVGIKSDGELLKFVEYCPEVNVLMRVEAPAVDSLRLIIGSPAHRKDVGIVLILGSARGFVVRIIPSSRILAGVVALLQDCVVPVQPADMVLVQRPLGVEGDRTAVHNLISLIDRHLCKRRFISIDALLLPNFSGRILRPASKHIPRTLKFVLPERGQLFFRVGSRERLRLHRGFFIIAVSIKFDSKAVARKHGDIVHHEHGGRSVLLSAPRERELLLHHVGRNSQLRIRTHRRQSALFIPADKMVALTRSRFRENGFIVYYTVLHRKAAALRVHIAPVRIVDGKVHRCHVFVLIDGVERYYLLVCCDSKLSVSDGIAGGLRFDSTQVILWFYKAPTGEILVIRDFRPGRKPHQFDRRAEGNAC